MRTLTYLSAIGMALFATLYFTAGALGGFGTVQIVSMLDWQETHLGFWLHLLYAAALALSAALLLLLLGWRRSIVKIASTGIASIVALTTLTIVLYSQATGKSAGFYEHYVGEYLTIICSLAAIVSSTTCNNKNAGPS